MTSNAFKLSNILINGTTDVKPSVIDSNISGAYLTQVVNPAALPILDNVAGDRRYSTSNNKLYIWTGSAWTTMTTLDNFPSIPSGILDSYVLATNGTATVITATSTDPGSDTITWSYSTLGLTNQVSIMQASNVFTIYPSVNAGYGGSFTLTIKASNSLGTVGKSTSMSLTF